MSYKVYSIMRHLVYKNGLVELLFAFLIVLGSYFPFSFLSSFYGIPTHPYTEVCMIILLVSYLLITMTNYAVQTGIISFVLLYGLSITLSLWIGSGRNPFSSVFLFVAVGVVYYIIVYMIHFLTDIDKDDIMRFLTKGETRLVLLKGDIEEVFRKFNYDETYARDLVDIDDKVATELLRGIEHTWVFLDEDREEITKVIEVYRLGDISREEARDSLSSVYTNMTSRDSIPLWTWRRV